MDLQQIPLDRTHAFSPFFLKYVGKDPVLKDFYSTYPEPTHFEELCRTKGKSFPAAHRSVLVQTLKAQYGKLLQPGSKAATHIDALQQNTTFTITTGHQLNVFTGPLYFIYKIITVINACRELKERYPAYTFVPVYWMASEDHDYEEIKSFRLYGKKYTWETKQSGAVGRFHLKDMPALLSKVPGELTPFREAYTAGKSLAEAVRSYVHALFGEEGLVVMDADHPDFKSLFKPVMMDDLVQHHAFQLVTETQKELTGKGLEAPVNPREINLFYLDTGVRARIEKKDNEYVIVDTALKFSQKELLKLLEEHPERFSPNVILRPLYQETILPNLAYVGGPAELVYWMELKRVFDHFQIPFPALMPRNFALIVESHIQRKLQKTGLAIADFFEGKNYLFNHWVTKNSNHNLSLGASIQKAEGIFNEIESRCSSLDASLVPMVKAEAKRLRTKLEKMEHKMLRAEKRKQSDKLRQIEEVKDQLFPGGSLQERTDNILNFLQTDPEFIGKLVKLIKPFDFRFQIIVLNDKR